MPLIVGGLLAGLYTRRFLSWSHWAQSTGGTTQCLRHL